MLLLGSGCLVVGMVFGVLIGVLWCGGVGCFVCIVVVGVVWVLCGGIVVCIGFGGVILVLVLVMFNCNVVFSLVVSWLL